MIKKFVLLIAMIPGTALLSQNIVINEVAASVVNSNVDDYGEYEDWIEVYNSSARDVDLAGWFITDNLKKPKKFKIPSGNPRLTTILAGSFLLFWPDRDTVQGPNHLGFALNRGGEELALYRPSPTGLILVDSVKYDSLPSDQSFGRCPERDNVWIILKRPTPGKANICSPVQEKRRLRFPVPEPPGYDSEVPWTWGVPEFTSIVIKVNELICNNSKSYADELGEYDDWVELYNPGSSPVNVAGWYVSDTTLPSTFHRIPTYDPNKTIVPAGGFLVLWADGQPIQGPAHLPFKFDKDGEEFYLAKMVNGQLQIMDQVVFPKAKNDVPYGRIPDGTGSWKVLSDPTPGTANVPARVLSGFVVNEIMAVSGPSVLDEWGEETDWIEFYNPSGSPVNLGGLYITDSTGDLQKSRIPTHIPDSTTIASGGYLLLYADNATWQGCRHLNFKLPARGEKIVLTQADGVTPLTEISYSYQAGDASYGRFPNGTENWVFTTPSPGQPNTYSFSPVTGIYINEILADNLTTFPDNLGEIEDWIELYNSNDFAVNVGGLYFSDSLGHTLQFRIPNTFPDSTTIPPLSFMVFWADNDPRQGVRHLDLKLSGSGEFVSLSQFRSEATILDSYNFGLQIENIAIGRYPDGQPEWSVMSVPSPGSANQKLDVTRTTGLYINEIMARSTKTYPDETGAFSDWIEVYNSNDYAIDLAGKYLTNVLNQPALSQVPANSAAMTTIPGKGYLIFRADELPAAGILHLKFSLKGSGDQVGLYENIGGYYYVIDSVTYGIQDSDISFGRLTDGASGWTLFTIPTPNSANGVEPSAIKGLYINEIMARNTKTIQDDGGRYEDWIELYNSTNQMIDIGGLYFSDTKDEPLKSMIPINNPAKTRIPAKSYLLVWPDLQRTEGALHLNFELAGAGEPLTIVQLLNGTNHILDSISYPIQTADISYGRLGDGAPWWAWFRTPTPDAANSTQTADLQLVPEGELKAYPNPFSDELAIDFLNEEPGSVNIQIIALSGKLIAQILAPESSTGRRIISLTPFVSHLGPGCYFIKIQTSTKAYNQKLLKIE